MALCRPLIGPQVLLQKVGLEGPAPAGWTTQLHMEVTYSVNPRLGDLGEDRTSVTQGPRGLPSLGGSFLVHKQQLLGIDRWFFKTTFMFLKEKKHISS